MKPKNYGKDISSITTPIRFHLPDGSSQSFKTSTEAQQWFNQNYGNGYSMVEHIPTQGDSEHPIQLQEVTVTAPAPKQNSTSTRKGVDMFIGANYSPSFNKHFYGTSDFDALFGKSRIEGVRKAWQRNPQAMQNWTEGGNAAAAFVTAPFAAYAAGEYALPWLAENVAPYLSARGWLGATQAAGNTPAWLTPTSATAIDATLAGSATGASINDMRENGPTVGNVLGTALGVGGLAYEAAPTIMEGYTAARNAVRPSILARKMNSSLEATQLPPELQPFITDFTFGKNSGRVIRADKGDGNGAFIRNGAYTKDGFLYPGQTRSEGQRNFTWWNENEIFSPGEKTRPYSRVFIARKEDIPGLQRVREMKEPVGQWRPGSKKAFVRKSEMVTPEPTDVTNLTQYNYDSNLRTYVRSDIPTHTVQIEDIQGPRSLILESQPTNEWNQVVPIVQNRPFVEAYNQWNRFGYPEVPKGMISDTHKLESFVRGQLNRHNTFSRGVQVMPSEKAALEQQLGRRLSDDEFLRVAATTPRKEGEVGQAGLWISPRTDYTSIYGGGKTALVRRPFKLGPDRMQWFKEASFNVQHNPGGEGQYTDIMAPWNTQPTLNWNGVPKYSVSTIPESELLSPTRMEFVDFVKGSQHMNNRTSLNSNPFFTKGQNHFDKETGQWVVDTYKRGGKLKNEKH